MTIRASLLLAASAAVLSISAAAAQEPADTVRLDTVQARVLRTPLPPLRAPYGVSMAAGEALRRAKPGLTTGEALAAIPGVQVDNRYNWAIGERIVVRGFGARAQFGVRGVRVLLDGIPATLPDGQTTLNHVDPGTLERAEVIRGPAAALYGNASGGVIRLTSAPPPPVPLAGEHRAIAGSHGLLRLQGSAGGLAGSIGWRANVTRLEYDGYRRHASAENTLLGLSAGWQLARDAVRLTLNAVDYDARNPGSLSDSLLRVDRDAAVAFNVTQNAGETGRQGQAGATWERRIGDEGSLEVAAYGLTRSLDNPIPVRIIDLSRRVGGVRASFATRSALGAVDLRWTAGGELEAQRDDRRNYGNEAGARGTLTLDQLERVTGTAAFAQATASLGRVDVLGAVRYDRFRFSVRDRLVTDANPDDSGERTMDAWSPTLGVSVSPAAGLALYANVSTAFETPTTTELANRPSGAGGFNPELEPQRTRAYEAGAKARLGSVATVELAAYRARVRDALIGFQVEGAPGRQFFRNAGSATHRGIEAAASVQPVDGLTARAAYTYTDARFGTYVVGGEDLRGNRVPGIAPHRVEAAVDWAPERGPFVGVDARWVSEVPVADTDAEGAFDSPAYALVDVRAGWSGVRLGRLRATPLLGITNLFDAEYNTSVVVNATARRYYEPGPARSFYTGVEVRM